MSLETADIGELDHLAEFGRLHGTMFRRVHLQGLVNPGGTSRNRMLQTRSAIPFCSSPICRATSDAASRFSSPGDSAMRWRSGGMVTIWEFSR